MKYYPISFNDREPQKNSFNLNKMRIENLENILESPQKHLKNKRTIKKINLMIFHHHFDYYSYVQLFLSMTLHLNLRQFQIYKMGCSDSVPVAQKQKPQQKPPELAIKPKIEDLDHFLLGHIAQTQHLFARVSLTNQSLARLSIPQDFRPYNFSSMLDIGNKKYIISGGIDFTLKDITSQSFIYDVNTHSVTKITNMHQPRYTHAALFFNNQLFVFGGRYFGQDQVAILKSCQVYSLADNKWEVLPDMNIKRCTCYAMLWQQNIYVFGGYTGEFQRSQKIQKLNFKTNKWEFLNFQLNRGIESGYVISRNPNEVTIFGGNTNSGPTSSVITLNFKQQSCRSHRHLKQQKMLHKCFTMGDQVFIFGGSDRGDLEIYNVEQNKSQIKDIKLNQQFTPQTFEGLFYSQHSLIVKSSQMVSKKVEASEDDDVVLTFGTTQEPFIFELNVSIPSSQIWSVPLSLKLHSQSGGAHLNNLQFLIFGGIQDDSFSTVTSDTYIYNHKTRSSKKLANMLMPRFSFAYQRIQNKIYAIGGGNSDPDGNLILLDSCQYFDLQKLTWNSMCSLPVSLISPSALNVKKILYILGGMGQNKKRSSSIYKYSENNDSWSELSFHLPFGIEATSIYCYKPNEFYIFGGRVDNGDSQMIWDIIFTEDGPVQCAIFDKGKMKEKKNTVKVFKPKNQSFLVCLGGTQDIVSYYDIQTLKPMEWDGLRRLKQVFSSQLSNLNESKMKSYLTIAPSNQK